MAEYFAKNRLNISLECVLVTPPWTKHLFLISFHLLFPSSIVMTTGHMSGGHLDEKQWMNQRPEIRQRAKAAIVCEHFGAIEWKDYDRGGKLVYEPTGRMEPMWTMAYVFFLSSESHISQ
jgi:hypothetical protein